MKKYTVEVGTFFVKKELQLNEPSLRIPLVKNTLIGRAGIEDEQNLCDGGALTQIDHPNISGNVHFIERPNFNGNKIIIPNDPHGLTRWVSRDHRELVFRNWDIGFYYAHRSQSGMYTSLWNPEQGITEKTNEESATLNLDFLDKKEPLLERYLLLGGVGEEATVEKNFPYYSHYICIKREIPKQ